MYCKKCGNKLGNEKFCKKCGAPNMEVQKSAVSIPAQNTAKSKKRKVVLICIIAVAVLAVIAAFLIVKYKTDRSKDISISHEYTSSDVIDELNEILKEHENEQ